MKLYLGDVEKKLDPGEEPAYKASWTGLQSVWTGLQSVLNRHKESEASKFTKCVVQDQPVHMPAGPKKWCFGGNLFFFHFCTPELGPFLKTATKT